MDDDATASEAKRRWLPLLLWGGVLALLSAPTGWWVTDVLERDNDFCNDCHLQDERPLHLDVRRDFDAAPAVSLAGAHGAAQVNANGDPARAFRCIDCHGGTSFAGRARVKLLAAKDSFWYVTGHFEEPEGMRWPLWDEDCSKCHASFDASEVPAWESPRFHQLAVHNVELGIDCVECHQVHETDVKPNNYFLRASQVRAQCARCHIDFDDTLQ